jgi:radical SAM protein with 4Fe4S-binding SPASM domain
MAEKVYECDDVIIIRKNAKNDKDRATSSNPADSTNPDHINDTDESFAGEISYSKTVGQETIEYNYKRPFIIELELTWKCNLKCYHCYVDATEETKCSELSMAEIKKIIDDSVELGMSELSLTGGEVFLCDHFYETLQYGMDAGLGLRFVTNGTLITDEVIEKLSLYPIKLVTVSLDACNEEIHNKIRGCDCYSRTVKGIERLIKAGYRVSIITAFSKDNLPCFKETLEFCRSRKLDWQVQITSQKGRCTMEHLLTPDQYYELGELVARAITDGQPMNIIPMDDLATFSRFYPLSILSSSWQGGCSGGKLNIFVRADGSVTPCSAISFEPFIAGNIRNDSLKTICQKEMCRPCLTEWLDPSFLTGTCAKCPHKVKCRGGCPEILCTMCDGKRENQYCYWKIEEEHIQKDLEEIW